MSFDQGSCSLGTQSCCSGLGNWLRKQAGARRNFIPLVLWLPGFSGSRSDWEKIAYYYCKSEAGLRSTWYSPCSSARPVLFLWHFRDFHSALHYTQLILMWWFQGTQVFLDELNSESTQRSFTLRPLFTSGNSGWQQTTNIKKPKPCNASGSHWIHYIKFVFPSKHLCINEVNVQALH